jgi:hypothetical protein
VTGVTAIETSAAEVTVSVTGVEATEPRTAVTTELPVAKDVAKPLNPVALLIETTEPDDESHVADAVRSCVVLSVNMPVAVNCCPVPSAILGVPGVTLMETKVAAVTVNTTGVELTAPKVALIVVDPAEWLVTDPDVVTALLMSATAVALDIQVTVLVKSWMELSV